MKLIQPSFNPSLALNGPNDNPLASTKNELADVGHCAAPVPHDRAKFFNGPVHIICCGLLFGPQQSCTAVVPGSALNPTGHCVQVNCNPFENVSAGQLVHAADPLTFLYCPATQAVHVPPFAPVNAALQVQAALAELETGAFEFKGHVKQVDEALAPTAAEYDAVPQSVQVALPVTILYLPATHAEHVPPFAPVNPALQVQAALAELETGAFEFKGQVKQVDDVLAPTEAEYVAGP